MVYILFSRIHQEFHEDIVEVLPSFPKYFQEKVSKYRTWQDVQLSILGRLLLRVGLEKFFSVTDYEIIYSDYNKPLLKDSPIKFNISHSAEMITCVMSKSDIGIDLELVKDIDVELFQNQMTNFEWVHVRDSANVLVSFFDLWTQKEAVLKADGRGLSIPMNSFYIMNLQTILIGKSWNITELDIAKPLYACHIACEETIQKNKIKIEFYPCFQLLVAS